MKMQFTDCDYILEIEDNYGNGFVFSLTEANLLRHFLNENYRKLRPKKDWANCSYEGHHDTCDCNGVGGDR